jgi:tetratricopeptide (TPR) repeat protein
MAGGKAEQPASRHSLDPLLEGGWLLIAVLPPLWVNLWSDQPFELSKVLLFRSLVWLLAVLWIVDSLGNQRGVWLALRRHSLGIPVSTLAVVVLLSTHFALDSSLSLFGSYLRGQGLLTFLSYILLFLIVTTRVYSSEQARRLVAGLVITAVPMTLLGLLQGAGWDLFGLVSDARSPIYATLGRANFVGVYLTQLLPLTLALVLLAPRRVHRRWLLLLAAGQSVVIAWTLARGAWLAAGVGLSLFGLLWFWPRLSRRSRRRVAAAGALIVALALAFSGYILLSAEAGSIAARRTIWVAVWGLIRERPLLGYGLDALELVFQRVYPPQLVYYQGREAFVDRAHHLLLDWAVTTGVLGMLSFLLLITRFFALGLHRMTRASHEQRILLVAGLASMAANLVGNLSGFDVTATATVSWLLMALVASPAMAPASAPEAPPEAPSEAPAAQGSRWALSGVLGIGVLLLILQFNVRPLLASVAHRTAVRHVHNGELAPAVDAAVRATGYAPWQPEHQRLLGQCLWRYAELSGDPTGWSHAEVALLTARDLRPADSASWAWLGDFYGAAGAQRDPALFELAHEAYREALNLLPHRARLYVAWGRIYLAEDRPEAALERLIQAIDLDATDDLAYRHIGDVQLALGRPESALVAYQAATHWAPDAALAHLGLARSYAALGQYTAARDALDVSLALDPYHPAIRSVQQELEARP